MKTTDAIPIFAVTGSPCRTKDRVIAAAAGLLERRGIGVLIVPQALSLGDLNRILWWDEGIVQGLLEELIRGPIEKESECRALALKMGDPPRAILTAQGCLDALAYNGSEAFSRAVRGSGYAVSELIKRYAAVIHIHYDAPQSYKPGCGGLYEETIDRSIEYDIRLIHAWERHPLYASIPSLCKNAERRLSLKERTDRFIYLFTERLDLWPS